MRVYYMTKLEYAKKIIHDGRMKICMFDEANDPFELRVNNSDPQHGLNRSRGTSIEMGVLCFGPDYKSPLMWAHYGDNHRGVCLGFDIDEKLLFPVEYDNRGRSIYMDIAPGMNIELTPDTLHVMWERWSKLLAASIEHSCDSPNLALEDKKKEWNILKFCLRKAGAWSYENEIRMPIYLRDSEIEESDGILFKRLAPDMALTEVILGVRCPESVPRFSRYIAHGKHLAFREDKLNTIRIVKTEADFDNFEIIQNDSYTVSRTLFGTLE